MGVGRVKGHGPDYYYDQGVQHRKLMVKILTLVVSGSTGTYVMSYPLLVKHPLNLVPMQTL